jgi:hypothetical protein
MATSSEGRREEVSSMDRLHRMAGPALLASALAMLASPLAANATLFEYSFAVELVEVPEFGFTFGLVPGDEVQGTIVFDDAAPPGANEATWLGVVSSFSVQLGTALYVHPGGTQDWYGHWGPIYDPIEPDFEFAFEIILFDRELPINGSINGRSTPATVFLQFWKEDWKDVQEPDTTVLPFPLPPLSELDGTAFSIEFSLGDFRGPLISYQLIPEPDTGLLVMTGLLGLTARRRARG